MCCYNSASYSVSTTLSVKLNLPQTTDSDTSNLNKRLIKDCKENSVRLVTSNMLSASEEAGTCHSCRFNGSKGEGRERSRVLDNKNKHSKQNRKVQENLSISRIPDINSYGDELFALYTCYDCPSSSSCSSSFSPKDSTNSFSLQEHRSSHHFILKGWRPFFSRNLTLGLFVLLLLLPNAMSTPLRMSESSSSSTAIGEPTHIRHNQKPTKWVNPCNVPVLIRPLGHEIQAESDKEIFQHIVTQAGKTEDQARTLLGDFFLESFGIPMHPQNDKYKDFHYEWLENVAETVGKYLGEGIDPNKLEELTVEDTLVSVYEGLQKFAVGLEQVVFDQGLYGGSFYQNFQDAEFQLRYVLCEIQLAMLEKNVQFKDISHHIMSQPLRNLEDRTMRTMRDYLIVRDYVNLLEYIRITFKFFITKIKNE